MTIMKNKFKISVFSTISIFLILGYTASAQMEVPTILGNSIKNQLFFEYLIDN